MAAEAAILDIRGTTSDTKFPCCPTCLSPSFGSIRLTFREQTTIEDFQDGHRSGHFEYSNIMILAILNLHVAPMPSTKFWLNPTSFRRRCGLKIFKMVALEVILDIEI